MYKKILLLCSLAVFFSVTLTQPSKKSKSIKQISNALDSYMQALTNLYRFSGVVVVAKGDKVLLNKGYGLANFEHDVPNTPTTKFRFCSITKMVTAVAILQLCEQGVLKLTDPITTFFPDYPRGNEITIHHLLSHTSGLPARSLNFPLEMIVLPTPLEKYISYAKDKPLEFEPGAGYEYCNIGYYLLTAIIEKMSGKSYQEFMHANIFQPLDIKNIDCSGAALLKQCASGYCADNNTYVSPPTPFVCSSSVNGAGSLIGTAQDLYTFARALTTGKLVNQNSLTLMMTPYSSQENYGYGCTIRTLFGHRLVEHGGMISSGFKTNVSIFVDDELYIVILSNFFTSWVNEARDALSSIVFGEPYELPDHDQGKSIDPVIVDEYVGKYNHPEIAHYSIIKRGNSLYVPGGVELAPEGKDKFFQKNRKRDNISYEFIRNDRGEVVTLRIKGGCKNFGIGCEKITS